MTDREDIRERHIKGRMDEVEQLFEAMGKGAVAQVEKLLARGVSPDCRDNEGKTALMRAAEDGNPALVAVLIRHGANVNALDADGETALMKAVAGNHPEIAKLLISYGADLNIKNNEGMTASEIADVLEVSDVITFPAAQQAISSSRTDTSGDPDDEGPTTHGPAGASLPVAAAAAPSHEPSPYVPEVDLESLPELERSPYFNTQAALEDAEAASQQEALEPSRDDGAEPAAESSGAGEQAESDVWSAINSQHGDLVERETKGASAVPGTFPGLDEERIEFDALDNKQVRDINEKIKKVLDKASFEVGDHVINTVFKECRDFLSGIR